MNGYLLSSVIAVVSSALLWACASPVVAADEAPAGKRSGAFMGTVESVDVKARTLKVKSDSSSMTFAVSKDAKIATGDKAEASLGDLKAGDDVKVQYETEKGVHVALHISPKPDEEVANPPGERIF
jgi:hypothetical protein